MFSPAINMPRAYDLDPANANLTGFASNVTGATWALTAMSSGDGLAHQVSIHNDSANDKAAINITLVGTDQNGAPLTETIAGPGASATVETTGYFLTLTSVTPASTWGADTADIGWVDEFSTPWINLDWAGGGIYQVAIDVTGTISFAIEQTFDADYWQTGVAHWVALSGSQTADGIWQTVGGATAIRLVVASYTDTAEIQMNVNATLVATPTPAA
jgi:hypothetical protein